jgi:hypothetical protein
MKCINCRIREAYNPYRYCRNCMAVIAEERSAIDFIVDMAIDHEREMITSSSSDPEDY